MFPACTIVVLCSNTGGARRALESQRQDGRDGHRACKIVRGNRRQQSRLDDFGDMLDLPDEARDPGRLQVRNVLAHGRRGRRGECDVCVWLELPRSMLDWSWWTYAQELLVLDRARCRS